jgi:hypothetical protein
MQATSVQNGGWGRETYGVETLGVVYVAERHGIVVVVIVICEQSGEPSA